MSDLSFPAVYRYGLRPAFSLCAVAVGVYLAVESWRTFASSNVHELIPGRVYRSAQQCGPDLEDFIRRHGIRTVINLRGYGAPQPWYLDESRAVHRAEVSFEDVSMSAGRYPSTHELRYLLEVLDHTEYPILIHCKQGADRTGLVAAFILLLETDATVEQARRQLSVLYGHVALGRPANLDRFLALYEHWLQVEAREHSPAALRQWIADGPREYRAEWEVVDFPRRVALGRPLALHVRAHNRGENGWRLQAESNAGIHAYYTVRNPDGLCIYSGHAGRFDAVVGPNEHIDLTLALPALQRPGRYRLFVDMLDEAHCTFVQTGGEPLEWEFEVAAG